VSGGDSGETSRAGRAAYAFNFVTLSLARSGTIVIFAVMILVNADVVGRYFFNRPIAGVAELVSLSIVAIVFLQLAHTLRIERFIRSDVLIGRLLVVLPRLGYAVQAFHHAVGAVLCALLFWYVWPQFVESYVEGDYVGSLGVFQAPKWPVELIVLIGSGLCAVQFVLHVIRDIAVASGRRAAPAPAGPEPL
jgi:TRAP-type mannitol/chloroaromatic compound transport system permease small subunit